MAAALYSSSWSGSRTNLPSFQISSSNSNRSVFRCYECGGYGHIARNCRSKSNSYNRPINHNPPLLTHSKRDSQRSYADVISQTAPNPSFSPSYKILNNWKLLRKRSCFRCGDSRHIVKDCSNMIRCFTCGGIGHRKSGCPEIYRVNSNLELMHSNCLKLCLKLISFLNLYEKISSNQKEEGAYFLLLMGWHIEGLVDGVLWRKVQNASRNKFCPPLPRPLQRKEHAISFCINYLKLWRIFSDSVTKNKRRGFRLLKVILSHFDIINTVVNCARGKVDSQVVLKDVEGIVSSAGGNPVQEELDLQSDVNGKGFGIDDEIVVLEDEMGRFDGGYWIMQHIDPMLWDPSVMICSGLCGINSPVVNNQRMKEVMPRVDSVDMRGFDVDCVDEEWVSGKERSGGFCVEQNHVSVVEHDVMTEACVSSNGSISKGYVGSGSLLLEDSGCHFSDCTVVGDVSGDSMVCCNGRDKGSQRIRSKLYSAEMVLMRKCVKVVSPEWDGGKRSVHVTGKSHAVLSKDLVSSFGSVTKGHAGPVSLLSKENECFNSVYSEQEDGKHCIKSLLTRDVRGVFQFSNHLSADRMNKRRRTSAAMNLWLTMNKGMGSVLSGMRGSPGSLSLCANCDQSKTCLEAHSQFDDSEFVGMQEDNGESSYDSDVYIPSSRRGKRRRVYPKAGLVRRSARIRSYTRLR